MKCEIRSQKVQFERYLNEKNDTGFARMITSFFLYVAFSFPLCIAV